MKRVVCHAIAIAVLLTAVGGNAWAQPAGAAGEYLDPLPIKPEMSEKQKRQKAEGNYSKVMRGTAAFDAQGQADIREWLEGFIIPAMTTPNFYAQLGDKRRDIVKDVQAARDPALHDFMVDYLFKAMQPLVEGNYPPPTRINAMLLIGELNQTEIGQGVEMFTPHPMTLPYLRQQLNDPNQIDGVRVAALASIYRHVESQWWPTQPPADDWVAGLKQEMLAIVNEVEPPAGRSPEAHAWFRGRATDVLGSLCGWAPDANSFQALASILSDTKAPISLRTRVAYALGRFNYSKLQSTGDVKLAELTGNIAGLLADSCKTELTWLEKERDEIAATGGGGPTGGSMPGGMMTPGMASGGGGASGASPGMMMASGPSGARGGGEEGGGSRSSGAFPFGGGASGASSASSSGTSRGPQTGGVPQFIVDGARRRLLYELMCVESSVRGPSKKAEFKGLKAFAVNDEEAKTNLADIETELDKLRKALDKEEYRLTELMKEVRSSMQKLDRLRPQAATEEVPDITDSADSDIPAADDAAADADATAVSAPAADASAGEAAEESAIPDPADVPVTNAAEPAAGDEGSN